MSNSSIWPIDITRSGAITSTQSGPGSNGYERILRIPKCSTITGASTSDCFMLYPGHSLTRRGSYTSAEIQLVYSTANWVELFHKRGFFCIWSHKNIREYLVRPQKILSLLVKVNMEVMTMKG